MGLLFSVVFTFFLDPIYSSAVFLQMTFLFQKLSFQGEVIEPVSNGFDFKGSISQ